MERTNATDRKTSQTIEWEDLILKAARARWGRRVKLRDAKYTKEDKKKFIDLLFSDAKHINQKEPEEISTNIVDVNQKEYSNHRIDGESDETWVKVVRSVGATEGHNYQVSTTNGVQWGANANVGLQFGLPQVGAGITGGTGGSFLKIKSSSETSEKQKSTTEEVQTHHEERVQIPPGKKVIINMKTYRVKYKLEYELEYKIRKDEGIRIRHGKLCSSIGVLTASRLLRTLPGFREDSEFTYFKQDGELRWTADKTVVQKTIVDC